MQNTQPIIQNNTNANTPQINKQKKQDNARDYLSYKTEDLIRDDKLLAEVEQKIREKYLPPKAVAFPINPLSKITPVSYISLQYLLHPHNYCSYWGFASVFPPPSKNQAFKEENLNVIDVHLRYYQYIYEKLMPYKWVPAIAVMLITKFHPLSLLSPIFFTSFVDHYFKKFFIWKYSKDKIINIRGQFIPKLIKTKNKLRRAICFGRIRKYLAKQQSEVPLKYIKFGQYTPYIFHTINEQKNKNTSQKQKQKQKYEQSGIHLTQFFYNYMCLKSISLSSFKQVKDYVVDMYRSFGQYKKINDKQKMPISINFQQLITYKDIRAEQVYNIGNQVQTRIKRWLEVIKFMKTGKVHTSQFSFFQLFSLAKHYQMTQKAKFNAQSNAPDLLIFYTGWATLKLFQFIIKRTIKM